MSTHKSSDPSVLVLYPPDLRGSTKPVVGAHCGAPIHVVDLPPMGGTIKVDPYPGQAPIDTVEINLNGQRNIASAQTETATSTTLINLPKRLLRPDVVNYLTYTVIRGSDNKGTSEPPLEILYNAIRPGNEDTEPGPPHDHSRLELLLPDAIKNGVGPDFPVAGVPVCVRYPYCRAYDVIRLNCNGYDVYHTVSPDQAPAQGTDTPVTVCFTLTRADLEAAKDHPRFVFSFTVTDQLGNGPDTDSPWSATHIVDVDLAGKRFAMPILLENLEDYPGDDSSLIELEELGSKPLSVFVKTDDSRINIGYRIEAVYTATLTGQSDIVVPVSGTVEGKLGQKLPCVLEVPNDQVKAGYSVTVVYQVYNGTTLIGDSRVAYARVVGEAASDLKPPTIKEAPNNTSLDPMAARQALTAIIPPEGLLPTDLLSVTWAGAPDTPDEGSHTTEPRPISEIGLSIPLPMSVIPFSLGKSVTVTYAITRGNPPAQTSQPLTLNVLELAQSALAKPKLKQAANNGEGPELHINDLTAEGMMWFSDWPFIALGQYVWLILSGTKKGGEAYRRVVWAAPFAHTNQAWIDDGFFEASAPYEDLIELADGSALTMEFKAGLGGSQDEGKAVSFPIKTYTVKALVDVKPVITLVRDSKGDEVANDGTTSDRNLTLEGTASKGQKIQVLDDDIPVGAPVDVDIESGKWNSTLNELSFRRHILTVQALYGAGQMSAKWTLTVTSPPPPLKIASLTASPHSSPSPHVFGVGSGFPRTGFNGARFTINVVGGVAPYTFTTSSGGNPIDRTSGIVTIGGKGQATFTVTDSKGATVMFTMPALSLYFSIPDGRYHNYAYAAPRGRLPTMAQMTATTLSNPSQPIRAVGSLIGEWGDLTVGYHWPKGGYGGGVFHPAEHHYWTSEPSPRGNYYVVSMQTGILGELWPEWQVPCTYVI